MTDVVIYHPDGNAIAAIAQALMHYHRTYHQLDVYNTVFVGKQLTLIMMPSWRGPNER